MESWSAEVVERAIVNCAGILDYSELRLKQAVVVQEFVNSGKDVFVSPPTASGKSHSILPKVFDDLRHQNCESSKLYSYIHML